VIFIVLLILPFVVSLLSVRKSREASLYVKSDNVRDPRYFSNSFRALVEKGLDRQNRTVKMSKLEPFQYAEELAGNVCNTLVIAEHRFRPVGVSSFLKEIYAASSAVIAPNTSLRAIACLDELELGENCEVIRWADSDKQMIVMNGCKLGMSATSATRLRIGPDCTFRRLYAPEIVIGLHTADTARFPVDTAVFEERWTNPEGVRANETVNQTIVTEYSLEIGEGAVIMGSIKSNHHIYIHQNARVNGNVVADGAIILDSGARVLGTVFSQDSILVGPGVEIGVKPKIKSLIARKSVTLCETAKVFGYIGCEIDSVTISQDMFRTELNKRQWSSKMELMKAEIAEEKADVSPQEAEPPKTKSPAAVKAARDGKDDEEESLFD
ncbi:MAG: polymer-forming cytoskeletal protein, partial [Bacillota bacterium]